MPATWTIPNQIRSQQAQERADAFAPFLVQAKSLQEAAKMAKLPERTARRYRKRLGL
jgi:hypothetical protein